MRTRNHDWFDTARNVPLYGVDVLVIGRGWMPAGTQKGPIRFDTKEEREAFRAELRRKPTVDLSKSSEAT